MVSRFKSDAEIPDYFKEVVFPRNEQKTFTVKVIFADYFVRPFPGFDFHEKWNNGIPPHDTTMYGNILKETNGMWYMEVHSLSNSSIWVGWCPKKCCTIIKYDGDKSV